MILQLARAAGKKLRAGARRVLLGERPRTSDAPALTELLGYQALVGDGVALMRDRLGSDEGGALVAGWWYRGPDIESASAESLASLSLVVNNALKKLDAGWVIHVEAVRLQRHLYERGTFAEAVDALIDEERDQNALHYVTECALFLTHAPTALDRPAGRRLQRWFTGDTGVELLAHLEGRVELFEQRLGEVEAALSGALTLHRMRSHAANDELLQALNLVVNGRWHMCRSPRRPVDLGCLLSRDLVWQGKNTRYGEEYFEVVGLKDLPQSSYPAMLHALTQVGVELRWSSRFMLMDYGGAHDKLTSIEGNWRKKVQPLTATIFNVAGAEDRHAVERANEVGGALADLESGAIRFGHYTAVVIVRGATPEEARAKASRVVALLEERQFLACAETTNRVEAWLGSLPGHTSENVRQPILHTLNLADMLPIGREWEGSRTCPCPAPQFAPGSPPLLQGRSWSGSRYFLNLHDGDLGHTLVLGPPGAGKSYMLATIASQWMRYPNAQVFCFDQGASMAALTLAHGRSGAFFRLGGEGGPTLCPLAEIDTRGDRAWATDWLEGLVEMQGVVVTPEMRQRLRDSVTELAESTQDNSNRAASRTLTALCAHLLDRKLESALDYYVTGPASQILNGDSNAISYAAFTTFELESLLEYGDKTVVPTVLYLFRQVEKRLDGRPAIIPCDEVWRLFGTPVFAERLRQALKTFRRRNAAVILATQQLSDVSGSTIGQVVFESCPTRILLPNENATQAMRGLYANDLNLSPAQIELLMQMERKRQYLHVVGNRSRVFELDAGPVARAFCGASTRDDLNRIWALVDEHGDRWPVRWLEQRGLFEAAARFEQLELEAARREVEAIRARARESVRKAG